MEKTFNNFQGPVATLDNKNKVNNLFLATVSAELI